MLPPKKKRVRMMVDDDPARVRSPGHMAWVRNTFLCVAHKSGECQGRMESHHVREEGNGGTGIKPSDEFVIPACALHHKTGHDIGWKTFESRYKVNLLALSKEFWQRSPHRRKWELEHGKAE